MNIQQNKEPSSGLHQKSRKPKDYIGLPVRFPWSSYRTKVKDLIGKVINVGLSPNTVVIASRNEVQVRSRIKSTASIHVRNIKDIEVLECPR